MPSLFSRPAVPTTCILAGWNARIRNRNLNTRNTRNSPNDRKMMNLKIFIYLFIYLLFRNILKMH